MNVAQRVAGHAAARHLVLASGGRRLLIKTLVKIPIRTVDSLAAVLIVLSVAFRLGTYDPYADGSWARHTAATIFGLVMAALVWAMAKRRRGSGSTFPAVAALLVLFTGDSVHLLRLMHPLAREGRSVVIDESFSASRLDPHRWLASTTGSGTIRSGGGQLLLQSGPRSAAHVDVNLGEPQRLVGWPWIMPPGASLPVERGDWLTKRLSWSAKVHLSGEYYGVAELVQRQLLFQAVRSGLHISYPDAWGGLAATHVSAPGLAQGAPHTWTVDQSPARVAVYLNEQLVWEGPAMPLSFIRLGDSRADPLHAGSMSLSHAKYIWYRADAAAMLPKLGQDSPAGHGTMSAPPAPPAAVAPTPDVDPSPTAPADQREHIVQLGDTLFTIAERYNTTVDAIMVQNALRNRNVISTGQRLVVP